MIQDNTFLQWHPPNSADKYYYQNLNSRNATDYKEARVDMGVGFYEKFLPFQQAPQ